MRICFLMEDFYPFIHGATTQTILLAERLTEGGVSIMVVTRQISTEHPVREKYKGMDILRVKPAVGVHRLGKYLMLVPAFLALLKARKTYDLIIVPDLKVLGLLGVVTAKLLGKKCLLNSVSCGEMDGSYATQYGTPPSRLKLMLIKLLVFLRNSLLMQADGFISISSAITREFLGAGVPENLVTQIIYGVDVNTFEPLDGETKISLRRKLGLPDQKHFLFTGRLIKGKGLEYLLRVWKRLAAEFKDIHLIIVGSGQGHALSCEDDLRTYVKENRLESTVTFTGGVHNVNEYLQAGDFFVFPSQSEGLGLSLIEAQACGLACIATNVGGILDIVEDKVNGLLVPYADEDRLFEVMKEVLEDKEKALQLGYEGRKTVLEKFDIDRLAKQYLALFNRLAEGAHS